MKKLSFDLTRFLGISILMQITCLFCNIYGQNTAFLIPLTECDQRYGREMQQALANLPSNVDSATYNTATSYLIMLKQQYDLEMKIKDLENSTFDTSLIALLRIPLSNYEACITNSSPLAQSANISIN